MNKQQMPIRLPWSLRKKKLQPTTWVSIWSWRTGWWFQRFFIFTPNLGEMIHFDEHIFQMGWFNHQQDNINRGFTILREWKSWHQPLRFLPDDCCARFSAWQSRPLFIWYDYFCCPQDEGSLAQRSLAISSYLGMNHGMFLYVGGGCCWLFLFRVFAWLGDWVVD